MWRCESFLLEGGDQSENFLFGDEAFLFEQCFKGFQLLHVIDGQVAEVFEVFGINRGGYGEGL